MSPSDRSGGSAPRQATQAAGRQMPPPLPIVQAVTPAARQEPAEMLAPDLNPLTIEAARMMQGRVPYLKYAFANPYNLSLVLGALAASVLTLNPLIALVALGGEAIWLLHAPGSDRLRHLLWDPRFAELKAAVEAEQRAARMQVLATGDRQRVDRLIALKRDIERLAGQNPSFTGELLKGELVKTDRLVESFLDMAVTCARYEHYLASVDLGALHKDRDRWEATLRQSGQDASQVDIGKKNLAVIMKRFDKMQEIQRYLTVARGQLDLIDNSFRLLADQIVTMQSPQELSGQLDELLSGVEAIKQSAVDTEKMLNSLGLSA